MKGVYLLMCIAYAIAYDLNSLRITKHNKRQCKDNVYWRVWNNKSIPLDAFVGGYTTLDCGSAAVYLVQGLQPDVPAILPAQLYLNSDDAEQYYNGTELKSVHYNWVLCSSQKKFLTWIASEDLEDGVLERSCVVAGFVNGHNMFFGRYQQDDPERTIIGRVFYNSRKELEYRTAEKDSKKTPFEVLCYNTRECVL